MATDDPSLLRPYLPFLFTLIAVGLTLLLLRPKSARTWLLTIGYLAIGTLSYLNWFLYEVSPPHGSLVIDTGSPVAILTAFGQALAAILLWPLWPVVRVFIPIS